MLLYTEYKPNVILEERKKVLGSVEMDFSAYKQFSFAFCLCIGVSIAFLGITYLEAVPENHLYIKDKYSPTQVNEFTHFIDVVVKLIENHVCYMTYHLCHDRELLKLFY